MVSSSSLGRGQDGLIPHTRKQLCLWEQELTSTVIFYGLWPILFYQLWQWGAAGWPYGKDVHSEDEPFSVFYLTEMFSFSHT